MNLKNRLRKGVAEWFAAGLFSYLRSGRINLRTRILKAKLDSELRRWENMETKRWFQSKTLWVNFLTILAGGLAYLASPDAKMDAQTAGNIAVALGIVNSLLRLVTDKPVGK